MANVKGNFNNLIKENPNLAAGVLLNSFRHVVNNMIPNIYVSKEEYKQLVEIILAGEAEDPDEDDGDDDPDPEEKGEPPEKKETGTLTISFQSSEHDFPAPEKIVKEIVVGEQYNEKVPNVEGYSPSTEYVKGTMITGGKSEIVEYDKVDAVI